uniref:Actin related protein 5 n=1 Tax=Lepisosteus oculatus TaxID=7918 RepID=W5MH77_LEPOC
TSKMAAPAAAKIFSFQDYRAVPDPVLEVSPECLQPSPVPIVIDNGSFQTRAGWAGAGDEFSAPRLQFKSVAARSRGAARSETQIGNDIPNLEPLRWLLKSQFDRNVVVNFEIQELMFDYIFMHLGIATEGCVEHPVVLTEAPCNPLHCRQMMSELLFECYGVPRVSYGVDSLYSFYYNNVQRSLSAPHTGIVISSGYHCSHILPVINGRYNPAAHGRAVTHTPAALSRAVKYKLVAHRGERNKSRVVASIQANMGLFLSLKSHKMKKKTNPLVLYLLMSMMHYPPQPQGGAIYHYNMEGALLSVLILMIEITPFPSGHVVKLIDKKRRFILTIPFLFFHCFRSEIPKPVIRCKMEIFQRSRVLGQSRLQLCSEGRPWRGSGCSAVRDGALGPFRVVVVLVESCTSVLQTPELEQSMEEGDGVAELEPEFNEDQPEADKPANPAQPVFNLAEYHQLFVGTERLRVPEILFQPSVIGEEQMGVMETLQYILDRW